jgi:hypothetical protein
MHLYGEALQPPRRVCQGVLRGEWGGSRSEREKYYQPRMGGRIE